MTTDVSPVIVEQLRTLDGHLFQDEKVLSVYLDTKSFVWTYLCSLLRMQNDPDEYLQWKDSFATELVNTFHNVRPSIENDLQDVVKKQSQMLGHPREAIIASPHVSKYLQGIFRRILQHDAYTSKAMIDQDPIKVDFIFREAFRSCLQNDCLTLFEKPSVQVQVQQPLPESIQGGQSNTQNTHEEEINVIAPEQKLEEASQDSESEESIAKSIIGPLDAPPAPKSVAAKSVAAKSVAGNTVAKQTKGPSSVVSKAMSAITSVSTIKKPKVKTVFLQDDDAISRFTKITSRQ